MNATTRCPLLRCFCGSLALAVFSFCLSGLMQNYSIDLHKVAGGGGTSTGRIHSVSGTIGQHDAGRPMTGGNYSLTGGFWSLVSVVQTAGMPKLTIAHSANSVTVSWPNTGNYTPQQNGNVANSTGWVTSTYPTTLANGTNSITVTLPPVTCSSG